MWKFDTEPLNNGQAHRHKLTSCGEPLSFTKTLDLWSTNAEFRIFFTQILRDSPFVGFRFETPPVTKLTLDQQFEFVLLRHDALNRTADRLTFREHFQPDREMVSFTNLRGDATLVVPCPSRPADDYGHLAAFVRTAPASQSHKLWIEIAAAMKNRVGTKPVWLSTAGMGVAWLHVRLDDTPKYYGHAPYRKA